ncbi:putative retinol dehydrogenase [Podospora aff. communis PSN243]|uniref:Retinol dehydrogenase n=1 Tax=Podospora aff. communis PSN243 TaxID=3040156 RepID=A0AAV9GQ76_9PEZI|nr:putative retinol dehydrogenase [Podospora aff. communis PSN243]
MPIPFILHVLQEGWPEQLPAPRHFIRAASAIAAVAFTKRYMEGALCTAERDMHGRVVLMTGGTSGIGAITAYQLAKRGAQLVLLTRQPPSDPFLVDYIDDLRAQTGNRLIYAEQMDLNDLHSVRQFATKWVDNSPPRRLDMIVLCAATMTPPGGKRTETPEGIETTWMVNFLANFHLLGILSPAIRAQPFDRDVRIILPTCSTYISAPPLDVPLTVKDWTARAAYARSKLALMVFGQAYQKHLDSYKRPDQLPMNARVFMVDPGYTRTPGMRRWLTRGSLFGLLIYMMLWLVSWLFLKSPFMGAQSILWALSEGSLVRETGGKLIKECMEVDPARKDVKDDEVAKKLWEASDKLIETAEKQAALRRAKEKRKKEKEEAKAKEEDEKAKTAAEIEALIKTIAKNKEQKEAQKGKSGKKSKKGGKATPSSS